MQRDGSRLRRVRLVDVPVALYRAAQQHADAVLRELVLMAEYEAAHAVDGPMRRLLRRADKSLADRLDLTARAAPHVDAALERGDAHVTLVHSLPECVAASTEEWRRLLDELDELCRDGTMLSVPAAPEVSRFTRWWCEEFVRQLRDGAAPTPWGEVAVRGEQLAG